MDIQDADYYSANTFVLAFNNFQQKPVSYRNMSDGLSCKSIDWFLYDASFC